LAAVATVLVASLGTLVPALAARGASACSSSCSGLADGGGVSEAGLVLSATATVITATGVFTVNLRSIVRVATTR
jgi:hypothetical protein